MLRKLGLALLIAAASPGLASAQVPEGRDLPTWSDAQKEVWKSHTSCLLEWDSMGGIEELNPEDAEAYRERCFNSQYRGWWNADPLPTGVSVALLQQYARDSYPIERGSAVDSVTASAKIEYHPLEILVHPVDDPEMAVVHWVGGSLMAGLRNQFLWRRCTSVLVEEEVPVVDPSATPVVDPSAQHPTKWSWIADSCGRVFIDPGGSMGEPGGGRGPSLGEPGGGRGEGAYGEPGGD
jgi:hypothetical protein